MKNLFKRGLLAVAAVAVPAGAILASPLAAHASAVMPPSQVSMVNACTHSNNHPDTTSAAGPATIASPDGPVWAHDNLTIAFYGVRESADTWSVTIGASGFYYANANPLTGQAFKGTGPIHGWLNYEVQSPKVPQAGSLPNLEPASMSQTAMLTQLFGGTATIIGGGHYNYMYTGIPGAPGGVYTQVG